jgi:hypothetical protein
VLGTKIIDGLAVEGQRITSDSTAGGAQDDKWRSVIESWYSPELRLILLLKKTTFMGESTTRLGNMNFTEPDPLLFRVPSDYTIVEQPTLKELESK